MPTIDILLGSTTQGIHNSDILLTSYVNSFHKQLHVKT